MSVAAPAATTVIGEKPVVNTPHITMTGIDFDHLEDVDDNREAVEFRVNLSEAPPEGWIQEFDQIYRQTLYSLKPPVTIRERALDITFLPRYASELPGFFQFLGIIIRRANEELQRTEEMHTSNAQEQRKAQFRDALRKIAMPQIS